MISAELWQALHAATARLAHAIGPTNAEVVVKPHPSGNPRLTAELLDSARLKNWTISQEPYYALLPSIDAVVSLFSTSILIPVLFGIPTIVLDSILQRHVHSEWDKLRELYCGLRWFCRDGDDLPGMLREVTARPDTSADAAHVRAFFADGAGARAIERLSRLLSGAPRAEK